MPVDPTVPHPFPAEDLSTFVAWLRGDPAVPWTDALHCAAHVLLYAVEQLTPGQLHAMRADAAVGMMTPLSKEALAQKLEGVLAAHAEQAGGGTLAHAAAIDWKGILGMLLKLLPLFL